MFESGLISRIFRSRGPRLRSTLTYSIERILLQGGYEVLDSQISDRNAPKSRSFHGVLVEYLNLGAVKSSKEAIAKMKMLGYRPAKDYELLIHDTRHGEQLEEDTVVVALGSVWRIRGGRVLVLRLTKTGRGVALDFVNVDWRSHCRFAAVRVS